MFSSNIYSAFLDSQNRRNWYGNGSILMAALLLPMMFLIAVDGREFEGLSIWVKPIKFTLSVIIHFITLAVLATLLDNSVRHGSKWRILSAAVVICGVLEVLYISIQAARGRASHFNYSTTLEIVLYSLMGIGALIMILGSFYLGILLARHYLKSPEQSPSSLVLASSIGLICGSILTLASAGYMSMSGSHFAGTVTEQTKFVPVIGWAPSAGDMRITHFVATHMMQILPLFAWLLSQSSVPQKKTKPVIVACSLIYIIFTLWIFQLALTSP